MQNDKICILDLFQTYKPTKVLQDNFDDVWVDKVRFSKRSKCLRIFVVSGHIIHYQYVEQLQKELLNYAKGAVPGTKELRICLSFQLSDRYGFQDILNEYGDSILYEIKATDPINYLLVKDEAWFVNDSVLTIPMPDSDLAKCRFHEIQELLITMFRERFQMEIQVGFNFKEEDKESLWEAHEKRLKKEQEQYQQQLEQLRAMDDYKDATETPVASDKTADKEKTAGSKGKTATGRKAGAIQMGSAAGKTVAAAAEIKEKPAGKEAGKREFRRSALHAAKDPDVFYGRNCEGELIGISEIQGELGEVVVQGQIIKLETREIRNNKTIVTFNITDFTDTISGKVFLSNDDLEIFLDLFKTGEFYRIKGIVSFDTFANDVTIGSIVGIKKSGDFRTVRVDQSVEKRVELHMHTVMSDKDSVVDIAKIIKRAKAWGHKAIAITDHGVVPLRDP